MLFHLTGKVIKAMLVNNIMSRVTSVKAVFLIRASDPLKRAGVYIMAVGIGQDAQRRELRLLTTDDDNVLMLESFDALLRRVQSFAETACEGNSRASLRCKAEGSSVLSSSHTRMEDEGILSITK